MKITSADVMTDYACMVLPKIKTGAKLTIIDAEVANAASRAIDGEIPEKALKSLEEVMGMVQALASMP